MRDPSALRLVPALLPLLLAGGCGGPLPPDTARCREVTTPRSNKGLTAALEAATAGDCVVLGSHTFAGSFRVPAGVQLLAGVSRAPRLLGDDPKQSTLQVEGGEGTRVSGLQIDAAQGGIALELRDGPAQLDALTLAAPGGTSLFVGCPATGCVDGTVELQDSQITGSEIGLWVDGAVVMRSRGNTFEENSGSGPIEGYGVTVTGGARLESAGDRVAKNGGHGLLVDGAKSSATLLDFISEENGGAGVWLQGLRGTSALPAFTLEGAASNLGNNTKAGLGAVDVAGIVVGTCIVHDTKASPWPLATGEVAQIADGIALLGQSTDVRIDSGVALSDNGRAQILVDRGGAGIVVGTAIVNPGRGLYGVVVQNTSAAVSVDSGAMTSSPASLGVDDNAQATP